jgi:glutathione S-transferase
MLPSVRLRFISSKLCPFAQRNLIVLKAKAVDVEVVWIDLFDKPPWLFELSPAGKVPLLEVDGEILAESNVLSEFLEEVFLRPNLHPETAVQRARHRMWIEAVSPLNMDVHRVMLAPDEATALDAALAVRQRLVAIEALMGAGPLFTGPELSLVDVAAAPALLRLAWCSAIEPAMDAAAGLSAVKRWQASVIAHDAVKQATPDDAHALWLQFLQGGCSPKRNAPPSWLGSKSKAL